MDNESWPPPPAGTEPPKMTPIYFAQPSQTIWTRYGFLLGVASNLTVIVSTVRFFFLPIGSGLDFEDWAFLFVMPLSFFAVTVGSVLSIWGIGKQREQGRSISLDMIGLVLNWLPYPLAFFLLHEAMTLRRLWDDG